MGKRLATVPLLVVLLVCMTACWPFTTGHETPTMSISNATVVRDEVTDLPTVTIDWDVHYPSDVYAQTTDISVVCTMSQRRTSGPKTITGAAEHVIGYNKDHYGRQTPTSSTDQAPATIQVPE